jgi:hypothetical protein
MTEQIEQTIIKETPKYILRVGSSSGGVKSVPCYQIVNKEFDVVEQEFFILAQALVNLDKMEELLEAYASKDKPKMADLSLIK